MDNKKEQKLLFQEFESVSTEQWEELIQKDLKGGDYTKKLVWKTLDGISVKPYYRDEDLDGLPPTGQPGEFPFIRGARSLDNNWLIRQDLDFVDANNTSSKINELIEKGVQSFGLAFKSQPTREVLIDVISGLPLDKIEINFTGTDPELVFDVVKNFCSDTGLSKDKVAGSLGADPIGNFINTGKLGELDQEFDKLARLIKLGNEFPKLRVFEVNAKKFHNSGSTSVQELGFAMSVAVEYLDELTNRGLDISEIIPKITFNLAVGSNYFFELAKFRSARSLWSRILEGYNNGPVSQTSFFHAETSAWNKTIYDPYVNLLRTTTEAMSAVLGGLDSLTILPFNSTFEETTDLSERLARNQQILLKEEAYLNKVIDPAAGSYYIENLTASLANEAWTVFQKTEETGGFIDSFLEGFVQDSIVTIAQQRDLKIALGQEVLLGTNRYANPIEYIEDQIDHKIVDPKIIDLSGANTQPLIEYRGAESFEILRLDTEKADKQPVVFLLTIGNLTMRKARASFASNFFSCAGYKIIDNLGFSSIEEGMVKAMELKADIVVLCSSDEEYAQFGPEAVEASGDAELVIAGYPKDSMDELHNAGICHFIHVRTNLLETLKGFNQLLGISQ